MDGACSMQEEVRVVYELLFIKSEGITQLGRNRRRWNNDIKIDTKSVGFIYIKIFISYSSQHNNL
jgi:hypothetical protein